MRPGLLLLFGGRLVVGRRLAGVAASGNRDGERTPDQGDGNERSQCLALRRPCDFFGVLLHTSFLLLSVPH